MIGIHPWFVSDDWKEDIRILEDLLNKNPVAGVGETGLDFQDRFSNQSEQKDSFVEHLNLANKLDRPVAVHCVRAWGKLIEVLKAHSTSRVLLHAYSGSKELIPKLLDLNCRFSFSGLVTHPNARRMREALAVVPIDRLLIETDAPDFVPQGKGLAEVNEPANLIHIAQAVSKLRKMSLEEVAEKTTRNAHQFFRIK
jgi:TatD DNase family protein